MPLYFRVSESNMIVSSDGKNLKTDDEGISILPAKSVYPILPKIKNDKNVVIITKGKLTNFRIFFKKITKKIKNKKIINPTKTDELSILVN